MSDTAETRRTPRAALAIVIAHVALTACFGQYYGKLQLDIGGIPLYPTELVVLAATLASAKALRSLVFDRFDRLVAVFVLFGVAWVALAGLGGFDGAGAKAFSFFVYSALFYVVRACATDDETRRRVLQSIAAAALVAAAIGAWQMQSGTPLFAPIEGSATGFEETSTGSIRWLPGEFALYAILALMVVAVAVLLQRRLTGRNSVVLVAAIVELVLAQHRSGFVAAAAALAFTLAILSGSGRVLRRAVKVLLLAAVLLTVVLWLFGSGYIDDTIDRIAHTADFNDVNIDWRLLSWYEVFEGVVAKPLGHGFAQWDFLFTANNPLTGSHNSFLDLAYRIGVPGLAVFLAIPGLLLARTRRLVQQDGPERHVVLVTVCAALSGFLVYSSFNVVFETPYMSAFFWILMGLGAGALEQRAAVDPQPPRSP